MWWWISIANKYIHQQNRMDRQAGRWEGFPSAATPRHYDGLWPNQAAWISAPSAKCELARQRFSYICMIAHVVKSAGITGQFPLSLQLRNASFCRGALQKHILRDKCEEGGNRLKGQKYLKCITWLSGCMPKEFKRHFSLSPPRCPKGSSAVARTLRWATFAHESSESPDFHTRNARQFRQRSRLQSPPLLLCFWSNHGPAEHNRAAIKLSVIFN